MKGKIALEEHFATEEYLQDVKRYFIHEGADIWERAKSTMCDISGKRLELMDEAGIEKTILSLSSPTIQSILSTEKAIDAAKCINDYTAEQIHDHRDRFEAFAALPTQSPEAAAAELERCVKEYDFKGALINGFCNIDDPNVPIYLDEPQYVPFWETAEKLDVPIYIHPRPVTEPVRKQVFDDSHCQSVCCGRSQLHGPCHGPTQWRQCTRYRGDLLLVVPALSSIIFQHFCFVCFSATASVRCYDRDLPTGIPLRQMGGHLGQSLCHP